MKKNILISIFGIYSLFITSCERHDLHTINGYLYENCSMTPVSNDYIELIQGITGGMGPTNGGSLVSGYTDVNGYFELVFDSQNNQTIKLMDESIELILDIPSNKDTKGLIVYRQPTCKIQVSLNVMNTYTETDTLYMTDLNNVLDVYKVAGPFENGFVYEASNFELLEMGYDSNPLTIRFNINGGIWATNWTDIDLNLNICDTNYVSVDIY